MSSYILPNTFPNILSVQKITHTHVVIHPLLFHSSSSVVIFHRVSDEFITAVGKWGHK